MGKYFNKKERIKNGEWVKKKIRLPRKVKKGLKNFFNIPFPKSKYFKSMSTSELLEIFAENRGQRINIRFGSLYYKLVIKHGNFSLRKV